MHSVFLSYVYSSSYILKHNHAYDTMVYKALLCELCHLIFTKYAKVLLKVSQILFLLLLLVSPFIDHKCSGIESRSHDIKVS